MFTGTGEFLRDVDHLLGVTCPSGPLLSAWVSHRAGIRTRPCVIFYPMPPRRILRFRSRMPYLPQPPAASPLRQRAGPRVRFAETTPAVLRLSDGKRVPGKLQLISISGGLLGLSRPLKPDSVVKVMFVAPSGSVLGVAKMLNPLSWALQPFCFITLRDDDESKLQAAIEFSLAQSARQDRQSRSDHELIEKNRPW